MRQTDGQTERQTDRQTDGIAVASTALAMPAMPALRRAVKTVSSNFTKFSVGYMLHVSVVRSFSDDSAVRYELPVL